MPLLPSSSPSAAADAAWRAGAALGAAGVLLGAFGAHGLGDRVRPRSLESWRTAASYQLVHALALLATGAASAAPGLPAALFTGGVVAFSGSIYALVLLERATGAPGPDAPPAAALARAVLGPVTPVGGLLLTGGWVALLLGGRAAARGAVPARA